MSLATQERYHLFIDGEDAAPAGEEYRTTIDPATEKPIAEYAAATAEDVDRAVAAAQRAQAEWETKDPGERGALLRDVADAVRENANRLAEIETRDQGKPLGYAKQLIQGAAATFDFYAGAADKIQGDSIPIGEDGVDFTMREPYGVSAQIIPWNTPLNLTAQGIAPALAAGNAVVVKPAPTTPLPPLHLAEICTEAGVPDGLINVVTGATEPGAALSGHEDVDTISFTGSVPTGQAVMESAAKNITPVTLELGGKNPAVVMPDADLEGAVTAVQIGIFSNTGQICAAADRAIVHEDVYDEFVEMIVERAEGYELGAGMDDPDMGPLNHEAHLEEVMDYIETGIEEGATLETGGEAPDRDGYFVEPTVFSDVDTGMTIAQEEIFGPVLCVIPFSDQDEAIEIANDIELGLTSGVFSQDLDTALRMTKEIEAGTVYVNQWFGGSTATPFGGYKKSGIGREMGMYAFESHLQTKNVCIDIS
ncbi:aldehyde dehydrogenase family protein [Halobellus rubicundus]|uniref:Aldehyde dehydrogenase n=1 Tax=Halobellus rubicundus TaxID=2996466 RepID=A0ABD5MHX8_9EURY